MLQKQQFRDFESAREFVHQLKLKSYREWRKYLKSGKKPSDIPSSPYSVYAKEWKGYQDWLGNFETKSIYREFLPFEQAREFARKLGLRTEDEWREFRTSKKMPNNIPSEPRRVYKDKWKSMPDWLGTLSGSKYGKYLDFQEAKSYARSLKLKIH